MDASRAQAAVNTYLRWAISGARQGPGMAETMELLGQEVCVNRLGSAHATLRKVKENTKDHRGRADIGD